MPTEPVSAIVKHISVHPKFRYHRRVGIFDDLDREHAAAKLKKRKYTYTPAF
ncbi:hypothetical protein pEaSNUABM14_00217 [Erwinia phage pEa_SNUABM_14]|nr:hypothetical protein pEaSNUABM14_00217 [Erwinia phage pEa_SNUABM_14]QYW05231.1 hypothetical protein pEaSNUABM21_00217 [Erwinia phage pEa_SNUABM_21]QYW05573.1 hypothetical protein pEaSNUABM25_00217 [Erwinia phage pEa_SNUABM_25]